MKFGQILVQLMTNISNSFSALLPTLETSSRPSNDFHKIAVQCNLLISSGWRRLFFCAHLPKNKQTHHNCFLSLIGWLIDRFRTYTFKSGKLFLKIMPIIISISWPNFMSKWFMIQVVNILRTEHDFSMK